MDRGLQLTQQHARSLLQDVNVGEPGQRMILRHMNCRVVQPGGHFYLIETGCGTNLHDHASAKVTAKLTFVRNKWVAHASVHQHEHLHRINSEAHEAFKKQSKKDKGGCIAWEVTLAILETPQYIVVSSGDDKACLVNIREFSFLSV